MLLIVFGLTRYKLIRMITKNRYVYGLQIQESDSLYFEVRIHAERVFRT